MVPWKLWIPKISCSLADYFRLCRSEDNILYFQENVLLHTETQTEKREGCHILLLLLAHSLLVNIIFQN